MQLVCKDKPCFLLKILLDALIHVETEPPLAVEEHGLCLQFKFGYIQTSSVNCGCDALWENQGCRHGNVLCKE